MPSDPDPDADTLEAAAIHEGLSTWIRGRHPTAKAGVILVALTYEIGRIAGQLSEGMSAADTRAMVDGIGDQMLLHIEAWRRGMRN